jgi:hypothetical protein
MRTALTVAAGLCAAAAVVPYLADVWSGDDQPRAVSWVTWSVLGGIGAAAAFSGHRQMPAVVLTAACSIECAAVAVLTVARSKRRWQLARLDAACAVGVAAGLVSLTLLSSPVLATSVAVLTDFVGAVPTLKHAWDAPGEETCSTYVLFGVAGGITLAAGNLAEFTAVAYPAYLLVFNASVAAVILASPNRRRQPLPMGGLSNVTELTITGGSSRLRHGQHARSRSRSVRVGRDPYPSVVAGAGGRHAAGRVTR